VVGGYGLLGAIYSVTPRLRRREKLKRIVEVIGAGELVDRFAERVADGFLYGDFQYATDSSSPDFLRRGVFSCYRPVDTDPPVTDAPGVITSENWQLLLRLAHEDKARAFELYAAYYLTTSGHVYWSDLSQLANYVDGYHEQLDRALDASTPASEMISEVFVPRHRLDDFLAEAAEELRRLGADVVYGTIRLIERDDETFLAWAKQPYACVIFNLHTVHTADGIARSAAAFRRLIDLAAARGGTFFLTYHGWATKEQLEACYPQLREFLRLKRQYDPDEVFQSEWYRRLVRILPP
jgi:FAD/FMN-containing dehydrogenase